MYVNRSVFIFLLLGVLTTYMSSSSHAKPHHVKTLKDKQGWKLLVDGTPMMIFGMNWGYIPIGQNYAWVLWQQPEEVIREALSSEMKLLKAMGVNTIRQYPDIPPKWVQWIFENYGIFTVINHTTGRYGFSVNGTWIAQTDYADQATRKAIHTDVMNMIDRYKDTSGVLMYLLGNENNYGLTWTSFEAEDLPVGDTKNAKPLYTLFGQLASSIKQKDRLHPIAIANGDLGYIKLIAEYCKDVDIMGSNVYRGISSRDLFDQVDQVLDKPFMYSEFGADAFDAKRHQEDGNTQAKYLSAQWQEIYEHSHGKGKSGVAIGGLIFQWSDGWWKHGQSIRLSEHDKTASWANRGYIEDFVEGENNMNEEWFGIASKDRPNRKGIFTVRPRTAYYILQKAFTLDPYASDTNLTKIRRHFSQLQPQAFEMFYKADRAYMLAQQNRKIRISRLELRLESNFSKGNEHTERPSELTVDHTESVFMDVTAKPNRRVEARVSLNVLGNVAQNHLNPIFYENRGRNLKFTQPDGTILDLSNQERVALYQAEFKLNLPLLKAKGFYRTGHYHWGDEGDFFGFYQEANYGPALDLYNGLAPIGIEMAGRKMFKGLKIAFGPELYWGANTMIISKYHRSIGAFKFTLMHQEDLAQDSNVIRSFAIPQRMTRKSSLHLGWSAGRLQVDIGALMAGSDRVGESFFWTEKTESRGYLDSKQRVYDDEVLWIDTLGAKARLSYKAGRWMGYTHLVFKGLVADAWADPRKRFTGWSLNESGQGNQMAGLAGVAVNFGHFQIAPHVLYQKPLVNPMETTGDYFSQTTGIYYPGLRSRNVIDDPFAVLDNRETLGLELLLVYDPTPSTWFWEWDNDMRENASFAASLDFVYRQQPTSRDSMFGVSEEGYFFAFPNAPPAEDVWDIKLRWISNPRGSFRLVGHAFVGHNQADGDSIRVINRYGTDLSILYDALSFKTWVSFNDWGLYDYYRDFNLTYPFQGSMDVSYIVGKQALHKMTTRLGIRGLMRTLDAYSPEFIADPKDPHALGSEWEITTYIWLNL